MQTIVQHLESFIPHGDRCESCPKADPHITGNEGPILDGYRGPYFCHLMEEIIADGEKQCGINEPGVELVITNYQQSKK